MTDTSKKVKFMTRTLVQELAREPTVEEVAEKMDLSVQKIRRVLGVVREPLSLQTPLGEEDGASLGDFIVDPASPMPDRIINSQLSEHIAAVLKRLSPREEKIIRLRFGFEDGSEHTLQQIAETLGVTRQRISHVEGHLIHLLRDILSEDQRMIA
jgi:RNA polymerase primary sigma factor